MPTLEIEKFDFKNISVRTTFKYNDCFYLKSCKTKAFNLVTKEEISFSPTVEVEVFLIG